MGSLFVGVFFVVIFLIVGGIYIFTQSDNALSRVTGIILVALGIGIGGGSFKFIPKIVIGIKEAEGQAQLAQATSNRRIQVEEAQAARDSARLLAEAEVIRARGVSEANEIVAENLGGPEGYLRYLYIESLRTAQNNGAQIIYVPTEAALPILEAGRLKH